MFHKFQLWSCRLFFPNLEPQFFCVLHWSCLSGLGGDLSMRFISWKGLKWQDQCRLHVLLLAQEEEKQSKSEQFCLLVSDFNENLHFWNIWIFSNQCAGFKESIAEEQADAELTGTGSNGSRASKYQRVKKLHLTELENARNDTLVGMSGSSALHDGQTSALN